MINTIADHIANQIIKLGINCIYIYPGGTIAPLVNSFIALGIKIEVFKHEQGAVYASMTGSGSTLFGIFKKSTTPKFQLPDECTIFDVSL